MEFLARYNGNIIKIIKLDLKYYFLNSKNKVKELKRDDFVIIG